MAYGQKSEIKIDIGSWYYWSSDLRLTKQLDRGKGVKYGHSSLMYVCMYVCK